MNVYEDSFFFFFIWGPSRDHLGIENRFLLFGKPDFYKMLDFYFYFARPPDWDVIFMWGEGKLWEKKLENIANDRRPSLGTIDS